MNKIKFKKKLELRYRNRILQKSLNKRLLYISMLLFEKIQFYIYTATVKLNFSFFFYLISYV